MSETLTPEEWAEFRAKMDDFSSYQDENGIDLPQIDGNLRLTPTERLLNHDAALADMMVLREAGRRHYENRQRRVAQSST
jgi:hypothetical protein